MTVCGFESEAEWGSNQGLVSQRFCYKTRNTLVVLSSSVEEELAVNDTIKFLLKIKKISIYLTLEKCRVSHRGTLVFNLKGELCGCRGNTDCFLAAGELDRLVEVHLWSLFVAVLALVCALDLIGGNSLKSCHLSVSGWSRGREVKKNWGCGMKKDGEFRSDPCRCSRFLLQAAFATVSAPSLWLGCGWSSCCQGVSSNAVAACLEHVRESDHFSVDC